MNLVWQCSMQKFGNVMLGKNREDQLH